MQVGVKALRENGLPKEKVCELRWTPHLRVGRRNAVASETKRNQGRKPEGNSFKEEKMK